MTSAITRFSLKVADGAAIAAYRSLPAGDARGIVQIAHGMAEHFGRYGHLTNRLTAAGYAVYANDHRGHGGSAGVYGLGDFGPRGFQAVVDDMAELTRLARRETPGRPLALFGHSMGSFASQRYLLDHPADLGALVLCGTAAIDKLLETLLAGGGPVTLEVMNASFEPARTPLDWLSRDAAEVDAYIADPMCGFALTDASLQSLFGLCAGSRIDQRLADVRSELPILVLSGEVDPVVGPAQAFVRALIRGYQDAGLTNISHQVYPGARHELLNETCRDEVERDLVAWLGNALGGPA